MPDSIHTARWITQVHDKEWEIVIFPSKYTDKAHPDLVNVVSICSLLQHIQILLSTLSFVFISRIISLLRRYLDNRYPHYRVVRLSKTIEKLRPDLIHTMEIQNAGYLALKAKKLSQKYFPKWIVTNWGSDIYLFGRLQQHKEKICDVLANSDYYTCECNRDIGLAKEFGFNKFIFPVFPNTGGFDLNWAKENRISPTSSRRLIMLKGYQGWAGRALVGLRALERCADILSGYTIVIYSAPYEVEVAAELFTQRTGIPIRILANTTSHQEMLKSHAKARISIGLSISDAISTSLLESIVMGSFPIQSCTACVDEWVTHGVNGLIVPPEDPDIIELAIRSALNNDVLVDNAADTNWQLAVTRLDAAILKQKATDIYKSILNVHGEKLDW